MFEGVLWPFFIVSKTKLPVSVKESRKRIIRISKKCRSALYFPVLWLITAFAYSAPISDEYSATPFSTQNALKLLNTSL